MLNLGCGQYLRNPFFPGFWGQKWGCGLCILADYTRLYTVSIKSNHHQRVLVWTPVCRNSSQHHQGELHHSLPVCRLICLDLQYHQHEAFSLLLLIHPVNRIHTTQYQSKLQFLTLEPANFTTVKHLYFLAC